MDEWTTASVRYELDKFGTVRITLLDEAGSELDRWYEATGCAGRRSAGVRAEDARHAAQESYDHPELCPPG